MSGIDISKGSTSTIQIAGVQFTVPAPFIEGHVLRPNEANVLNQTYAENLRNNFAARVKEAKEKGEDLGALQKELDNYIQEYDFGARRVGGESLSPEMREALSLATKKVKEALQKKGVDLKTVDKEKIRDMAKEAVEKYPQILESAKKIVELKKSVTA